MKISLIEKLENAKKMVKIAKEKWWIIYSKTQLMELIWKDKQSMEYYEDIIWAVFYVEEKKTTRGKRHKLKIKPKEKRISGIKNIVKKYKKYKNLKLKL